MYSVLTRHAFVQPEAEDTVWRYMDLARFVSILENSALHFSQARLMADKWEGAWGGDGRWGWTNSEELLDRETLQRHRDSGRSQIYLNCWNLSEFESAAMWDIYQREGRGVAIRTTWGRLTDSIGGQRDVHGGKVAYIDIRKIGVPDSNIFTPFMHKRVSFAHENEARLMHWALENGGPPDVNDQRVPIQEFKGQQGFKVEVNIETLIESVYVAPGLPEWITELVTQVVARYGYDFPVVQSDLDTSPLI